MSATICVRSDQLIAQPDGQFTVRVFLKDAHDDKKLNEFVVSVQADGSIGYRSPGTAGPYEKGQRLGNTLVFTDPSYPAGAYALLLVG